MAIKIKFPILKDVDYIDVSKGKSVLLTLKGVEVEGISWREFQLLLGQRLGAGTYYYKLKFANKQELHSGSVKGVDPGMPPVKVDNNDQMKTLEGSISALSLKIEKMGKGEGVSVETLLDVTRTSYQGRIDFMLIDLNKKDNEYSALQGKFDALEKELDDQDDIIDDLKSKTGLNQYSGIIERVAEKIIFSKIGTGKGQPLGDLSMSDPKDLPPEIMEVLGVVAWDEVTELVLNKLLHFLKIYITELPQKGVESHGN